MIKGLHRPMINGGHDYSRCRPLFMTADKPAYIGLHRPTPAGLSAVHGWGPPAGQPLPLGPRPRAVARWPSPPCAQLQLPARQPRPNPRQATLAGLHAVLRWRLRRGPSTCRRLSLTPGTLSSFQMRAVLRVDQVDQFLRALGKRGAMCSCSLSEVACRMVLSCAPKARIHALQVTALMTTSLTPSRQRTPVLGDPASAPCPCPCVRNSCASLSGVFTPRRIVRNKGGYGDSRKR